MKTVILVMMAALLAGCATDFIHSSSKEPYYSFVPTESPTGVKGFRVGYRMHDEAFVATSLQADTARTKTCPNGWTFTRTATYSNGITIKNAVCK